jgi:hypothetical protein
LSNPFCKSKADLKKAAYMIDRRMGIILALLIVLVPSALVLARF